MADFMHGFKGRFSIRQLPKTEYRAMRHMIEALGFTDESELFATLISLGYEVCRYQDGAGRQWLLRVLDTLRTLPEAQRVYPSLQDEG